MLRIFSRSNLFQSLLIIIALALGVAVVTAVAAYVELANFQLNQSLASTPYHRLEIIDASQALYYGGSQPKAIYKIGSLEAQSVTFREQDLENAKTASPSVDYAYIRIMNNWITDQGSFPMLKVTIDYLMAEGIKPLSGTVFSQIDYDSGRKVMIITKSGASRLGLDDPVGKTYTTPDNHVYEIIGLIDDLEGQLSPIGIAPYDGEAFGSLTFHVNDINNLRQAKSELAAFAEKTWGKDAIVISQSLEDIRQRTRASTFLTAIFACLGIFIASVSLLNLFITRVHRSHREIAIRRSIGASRVNIRNLFLTEALSLGLLGGIIGILLGYILIKIINSYMMLSFPSNHQPVMLSPLALIIGLTMSLVLPLLFALYPATLASKVNVLSTLGRT